MWFVQLLASVPGVSKRHKLSPLWMADPSETEGRESGEQQGWGGSSRHHQALASAMDRQFPDKPPASPPSGTSRERAQAARSVSSPASPGAHTPGSGG